jgi:hypothetical protein
VSHVPLTGRRLSPQGVNMRQILFAAAGSVWAGGMGSGDKRVVYEQLMIGHLLLLLGVPLSYSPES